MRFSLTIEEVRRLLPDAEWRGQGPPSLEGLAALIEAGPGDLSFLGNSRYAKAVPASRAGAILLPRGYSGEPGRDQWHIRVEHPSLALAIVCEHIERAVRPRPAPGVHPSAVIDPTAEISADASVGPLCVIEAGAKIEAGVVLTAHNYIGRNARVGADTRLYPRVVVEGECIVGARCICHAGVVIGADGFGFEATSEGHRKVPQVGHVEIGDDVEIGANTTIDRGRFGATRVGQGTKIDNLVQIGHNVVVGRHCFLCAQVGVSGSTRLGDFVVLAGQAGLAGHLQIGDKVQVGAQAGVAKDLREGMLVTGTPATDFQKQRRLEALVRRLPSLFERVDALELRSSEEGTGG